MLASEKGALQQAVTAVFTSEVSALDAYVHVAAPIAAWCKANKAKKLAPHAGGAYKAFLETNGVSKHKAKRLVERVSHFVNPEHKQYRPGFLDAALKGFNEAKECLKKQGIQMAGDIDRLYDKAKGGSDISKADQIKADYKKAKKALEALPRHLAVKLYNELGLSPSIKPVASKPKGKKK